MCYISIWIETRSTLVIGMIILLQISTHSWLKLIHKYVNFYIARKRKRQMQQIIPIPHSWTLYSSIASTSMCGITIPHSWTSYSSIASHSGFGPQSLIPEHPIAALIFKYDIRPLFSNFFSPLYISLIDLTNTLQNFNYKYMFVVTNMLLIIIGVLLYNYY